MAAKEKENNQLLFDPIKIHSSISSLTNNRSYRAYLNWRLRSQFSALEFLDGLLLHTVVSRVALKYQTFLSFRANSQPFQLIDIKHLSPWSIRQAGFFRPQSISQAHFCTARHEWLLLTRIMCPTCEINMFISCTYHVI